MFKVKRKSRYDIPRWIFLASSPDMKISGEQKLGLA
jgi:hypothetical protein